MVTRTGPHLLRLQARPSLRAPTEDRTRMRVAINLLTDDPRNPSGAHWFWTRMVPEMATRLLPGEELHLILSPKARRAHPDYGETVRYITFPWSNEHRLLRTASEHLFTPFRLPLSHIDVLNTGFAPLATPTWSLVLHIKTMHAYTAPGSVSLGHAPLSPSELPALGPARGGDHRQLQQPAQRNRSLSGG